LIITQEYIVFTIFRIELWIYNTLHEMNKWNKKKENYKELKYPKLHK
jgi:hypothetical protein